MKYLTAEHISQNKSSLNQLIYARSITPVTNKLTRHIIATNFAKSLRTLRINQIILRDRQPKNKHTNNWGVFYTHYALHRKPNQITYPYHLALRVKDIYNFNDSELSITEVVQWILT